ncbi:hypothetical protein EDD86DRAFT_124024 [Gorgonomyces haynaldii]|nr:hypothetical protein EDD86DRAFT_124024 [Gorgonomyces haynaldii]
MLSFKSRRVPIAILVLVVIALTLKSLQHKPLSLSSTEIIDTNVLVLVFGHAIFKSLDFSRESIRNEENWYLEPYQHGQTSIYLSHIEEGVKMSQDGVLMFSGGFTRKLLLTEAYSYYQLMLAMGLEAHVMLEEFARDSFENVAFGLCRFYQVYNRFPEELRVVSFDFKMERIRLHFETLNLNQTRLTLKDSAPMPESEQRTLEAFKKDPWGCSPPLSTKKEARNPFRNTHPYNDCPILKGCP